MEISKEWLGSKKGELNKELQDKLFTTSVLEVLDLFKLKVIKSDKIYK